MSQQKEFRAIHNVVIQAALRMERITFEDRSMEQHDEPDDILRNSKTCEQLWTVIRDDSFPLDLRGRIQEKKSPWAINLTIMRNRAGAA